MDLYVAGFVDVIRFISVQVYSRIPMLLIIFPLGIVTFFFPSSLI